MSMEKISIDFLTIATVNYAAGAIATLRSAKKSGNYKQFHLFILNVEKQMIKDGKYYFFI